MQSILQELLNLLDLEQIEVNLFRGRSQDIGVKRVFGGQVLGQALMAAYRTVEPDRFAHSLHAYFLRPGDVDAPIVYDVDRIRDGKSFTTRHVVAIQHGQAIFNLAASFQLDEDGLEHQTQMPANIPNPEHLISEDELRKEIAKRLPEKLQRKFTMERPIEIRPIDLVDPFNPEKKPPFRQVWFRALSSLPDDRRLHHAILAYASDFGLLAASLLPHGLSFMQRDFQAASLDHSIWFHRKFRADEWLFYDMDSPSASNARGFNRGNIFTQSGILVASVAQEGLMRLWPS